MLKRYLEYGYYNKLGAFLNLFFGASGEKLISNFIEIKLEDKSSESKTKETFNLKQYTNNNQAAINIQKYLLTHSHEAIVYAILHGSLSDGRTTSFSDFDAVLVYDESKITNSNSIYKLRKIIKETHLLMFEQDALQHHSWMLLSKNELDNFNDNLFPSTIFENAAVLFPKNNIQLDINKIHIVDYSIPFRKLSKSILRKLSQTTLLNYFYFYKNLISEILLLPATWYSAMTNSPISKKESFQAAKELFNNEKWSAIESFEEIRLNWNQDYVLAEKEKRAIKYKLIKYFSFKHRNRTPEAYYKIIEDENLRNIVLLLTEMENKLRNRTTQND